MFHSIIEFGHTLEELEKVQDDSCWDFAWTELGDRSVEFQPEGMVYWFIDGRLYETILTR